MKKLPLLLSLTFISLFTLQAQVKIGNNPTVVNPDALLELEHPSRGTLIPRIALTAVNNAAPLTLFTAGMLVYNTASAGTAPNNVTPGFYFSDGSKWLRAINAGIEQSINVSGLGSNLSSPNSFGGAAFSPNTPATTGYIYTNRADGTAWIYNGSQYVRYSSTPSAPWYLAGGTTDAGANKTGSIYRTAAVAIGTGNVPDPSSLLDLNSTSKGFLTTRMQQAQLNAIAQPAPGLEVYCTDCLPKGLYVNNGTAAAPAWGVLGSTAAAQTVVSDCSINGFAGTYQNGVALTAANSFSVTITNTSLSAATINVNIADLVLSGTSGVAVAAVNPATSVTLSPGTSQQVTYSLSGTPATAGTLTGSWAIKFLNCTKTQTVIP